MTSRMVILWETALTFCPRRSNTILRMTAKHGQTRGPLLIFFRRKRKRVFLPPE
jgi:hypothetical protein